jgi:RHS repeat-associated protein
MDTAKGYTGQYADTLTGLDYYVSRYYDPVAGIFLSPDMKEGNAALQWHLWKGMRKGCHLGNTTV